MDNERTMSDHLRRAWDQISGGGEPEAEINDSGRVDTVHRLRSLDAMETELSPDPAFVRQLEEQIMDVSTTRLSMRTAHRFGARTRETASSPAWRGAPERPRESRRSTSLSIVAAAAVILLTLASGFAAIRLAPDQGGQPAAVPAVQATAPGEQRQVPGPEECDVEPLARERTRPRGTPATASLIAPEAYASGNFPMLRMNDLPDGPPADAEATSGITATLRVMTACLNARDYARLDALFTDDYRRRLDQVEPPSGIREGDGPGSHPTPAPFPEHLWDPVPAVEETRVLKNGRIGAIVASTARLNEGATVFPGFYVFGRVDDRWLIDDHAPVGDAPRASLLLIDIAYEPFELEIPADAPVALSLENVGQARHTFNVDGLDISIELAPGQSDELVINAPAGEYEFYCSVPGHREAGMVGQLLVYGSVPPVGTPTPDAGG